MALAASRRVYDQPSGQWKDGGTPHAAESLQKGMRVIVTGRLGQRDYQADDGTSRTVYELDAGDFGPPPKWATAKVTKITRDEIPHPAGDTSSWRTAAASAPGSGFSDEPPF